jgi:hypothetical protein
MAKSTKKKNGKGEESTQAIHISLHDLDDITVALIDSLQEELGAVINGSATTKYDKWLESGEYDKDPDMIAHLKEARAQALAKMGVTNGRKYLFGRLGKYASILNNVVASLISVVSDTEGFSAEDHPDLSKAIHEWQNDKVKSILLKLTPLLPV